MGIPFEEDSIKIVAKECNETVSPQVVNTVKTKRSTDVVIEILYAPPWYQCSTSVLALRVPIFHAIISSPFLHPHHLVLSTTILYCMLYSFTSGWYLISLVAVVRERKDSLLE